ncbi:RDD family protein [Cellulosilyticum ruminicola]|uniref:RDD family protein n=1 Tax=Cellulosilyticum ruminicola TaxID=425254 RepID=UPI001FA729B7|nr:RDD family protein [Cellulosilyticum ruminicola]
MYCRKCGTWCDDSAVFCSNCGEALGEKIANTQEIKDRLTGNVNYGYENNVYNNNGYGGNSYMGSNYAGFWKRFLASLIDGIILAIVEGIIGAVLRAVGLDGIVSVVGILIGWLYFAYMESSENQGTIGKIALHMKVMDVEGNPVTFARATARYFSKFLSGLILFIGYMMAGWTENKQALHDIIAGTFVVEE